MGSSMATLADSLESRNTGRPAEALANGPLVGALLPLVRINGRLFVVENCLHFWPASNERPDDQDGCRSADLGVSTIQGGGQG
jgi:hypothetical protein